MNYDLIMKEAIWIEIESLQQYRFKPSSHYAGNAQLKCFCDLLRPLMTQTFEITRTTG